MNKLRVLELFGGIASFSKGLERAGIPYEIVDYVDIDKYAVKAFNAIHGTNYEPQDICKWNKDIKVDMICHGSPCQSFSVAGLGHGGDKDSGTRSSLMWETVRIVEKLKPKYVCWENVKGLLTKKHKHNFDLYLKTLEDLGYNNYYQILNAKNYLIPQNRERVFTISIRKDVDDGSFTFPATSPLKKRLKDILEKDVDEKYYLSEERLKKIKLWDTRQRENGRGFRFDVKDGNDVSRTITTSSDRPAETTYVKDMKQVAQIYGFGKEPNPQAGRVYDKDGVSPTLDTCSGGNRMPKIVDDLYAGREPRIYDEASPTLRSERTGLKVIEHNKNPKHQQDLVQDSEGLCRTIPAGTHGSTPHLLKTVVRELDEGGGHIPMTNVEPQPIKRRRSELGKELRKAYENHEIPANENMRENYIGDDGVMPTLTCSKREQKIAEPQIIDPQGRTQKINKPKPLAPTLRAQDHGNPPCAFYTPYRIRRLTAKECWRLMNRDDWEYDKAEQAGISSTQLYKIAGNSIVAACPTAIFSQLLGERKWNKMSLKEREALIFPEES